MCGILDFMCQCCEIFRRLWYRDMFENLLKYNQEEMNSLWKADPVDDFLENSIFKWNFDDGEDLFETSFHTEQEVTHSPPSLEKRNAKFRIGNPSKNTLPGRELFANSVA